MLTGSQYKLNNRVTVQLFYDDFKLFSEIKNNEIISLRLFEKQWINIVYLSIIITPKWFKHFPDYESNWLESLFPFPKKKSEQCFYCL